MMTVCVHIVLNFSSRVQLQFHLPVKLVVFFDFWPIFGDVSSILVEFSQLFEMVSQFINYFGDFWPIFSDISPILVQFGDFTVSF